MAEYKGEGDKKGGLPPLTSKCSLLWTVFSAAIQSSISFLLSAHRMSFLHGVMT